MFRSKKQEMVKREVIIVLTPFVLPEEQVIGKNMPMDEDNFEAWVINCSVMPTGFVLKTLLT